MKRLPVVSRRRPGVIHSPAVSPRLLVPVEPARLRVSSHRYYGQVPMGQWTLLSQSPSVPFGTWKRFLSTPPNNNTSSSVQEPSSTKGRKSRSKPSSSAQRLLDKVQTGRLPSDLVCQQVRQVLTELLTAPPTKRTQKENAALVVPLLDLALEHAQLPNEPLIPRLFSMGCQVLLFAEQFDQVHRQLTRLLDHHDIYLMEKDVEYNARHVNEACGKYIQERVLHASRTRRTLTPHQRQQLVTLMDRMQAFYDDDTVPLAPTTEWYTAKVFYCCSQHMPQEAYRQLRWMVEQTHAHRIPILPPVTCFTATIAAFAKTSPETSLEILQWMLTLTKENQAKPHNANNMPIPNVTCFNALLDAWAKRGRPDAGLKAEQTLEWMKQLYDTEGLPTEPDEISYNCCINAWANSSNPQAPMRAESILRDMISKYQSGREDLVLTNYTFTSVMNAWANSKREEAPDRISSLLRLMKELSPQLEDVQVNSFCYSVLVKAWEQVGMKNRRNTRNRMRCLDEIFAVLKEMDKEGIPKTPGLYNSVIMAQLEFSAISAVLYFLEIEEQYRNGDLKMSTRTFNSGLSALAALNKPDVSQRSMGLFQRMVEYSKTDPNVQPDQTTYNLLLKVMSRSPDDNAAEAADNLLTEMEGKSTIKTSPTSYGTVIIAWGRNPLEIKWAKVQEVLRRYRALSEQGNIVGGSNPAVYNAALSVCQHNATPLNWEESQATFHFVLQEMRNSRQVQPDHTTYLTLFRAIENLYPEGSQERFVVVEAEFDRCIKEGWVSPSVLESVVRASPQVFDKMFGAGIDPHSIEIPQNWSKRARRSKAGQ